MICEPCRRAGDILSSVEDPDPFDESNMIALHRRCKGGTFCDCQHSINPNMLNQERIKKNDG
jgi:hypothetical protein